MADWTLIKSEYISDPEISTRALAAKHGVSYSTLAKKCCKEHWEEARKQQRIKVVAKVADKIASKKVSQAEKIIRATDDIADRIIDAMSTMDLTNAAAVRQMTLALKDLREIYNLNKTKLDEQEQKARIENLQAKIPNADDDESGGGVVLLPIINDKLVPPDEE